MFQVQSDSLKSPDWVSWLIAFSTDNSNPLMGLHSSTDFLDKLLELIPPIGVVCAREDIHSNLQSPRTNIDIRISMTQRKER